MPRANGMLRKVLAIPGMLEISRTLARDFNFVRVDLYESDNCVFFGELTLYPGSGFEGFQPEEWDYIFGDWLSLPTQSIKHYTNTLNQSRVDDGF